MLPPEELTSIDAYWRAANYLSVGQIYLLDNPLLGEPLALKHIKPRLLGHWGTSPGLSFIYVHLNRAIRQHDLKMIFVTGPGHGAPAIVANCYLEGSYTARFPHITEDAEGMKKLYKQFSFPGGIPSHTAPETPGSIHEGGELGYSLTHAYGAAFDNPDLIVACVVGDGEAETGPLATAWHSNKFLNPATDGAVLPILHLNGYKIANPTVLARIGREELDSLMRGYGYEPLFVEGTEPHAMHQLMAATLETALTRIADIQDMARNGGMLPKRPRWPMIVLVSPKGTLDVAIEISTDEPRISSVAIHHVETSDLIALVTIVETEVGDATAVGRDDRCVVGSPPVRQGGEIAAGDVQGVDLAVVGLVLPVRPAIGREDQSPAVGHPRERRTVVELALGQLAGSSALGRKRLGCASQSRGL